MIDRSFVVKLMASEGWQASCYSDLLSRSQTQLSSPSAYVDSSTP